MFLLLITNVHSYFDLKNYRKIKKSYEHSSNPTRVSNPLLRKVSDQSKASVKDLDIILRAYETRLGDAKQDTTLPESKNRKNEQKRHVVRNKKYNNGQNNVKGIKYRGSQNSTSYYIIPQAFIACKPANMSHSLLMNQKPKSSQYTILGNRLLLDSTLSLQKQMNLNKKCGNYKKNIWYIKSPTEKTKSGPKSYKIINGSTIEELERNPRFKREFSKVENTKRKNWENQNILQSLRNYTKHNFTSQKSRSKEIETPSANFRDEQSVTDRSTSRSSFRFLNLFRPSISNKNFLVKKKSYSFLRKNNQEKRHLISKKDAPSHSQNTRNTSETWKIRNEPPSQLGRKYRERIYRVNEDITKILPEDAQNYEYRNSNFKNRDLVDQKLYHNLEYFKSKSCLSKYDPELFDEKTVSNIDRKNIRVNNRKMMSNIDDLRNCHRNRFFQQGREISKNPRTSNHRKIHYKNLKRKIPYQINKAYGTCYNSDSTEYTQTNQNSKQKNRAGHQTNDVFCYSKKKFEQNRLMGSKKHPIEDLWNRPLVESYEIIPNIKNHMRESNLINLPSDCIPYHINSYKIVKDEAEDQIPKIFNRISKLEKGFEISSKKYSKHFTKSGKKDKRRKIYRSRIPKEIHLSSMKTFLGPSLCKFEFFQNEISKDLKKNAFYKNHDLRKEVEGTTSKQHLKMYTGIRNKVANYIKNFSNRSSEDIKCHRVNNSRIMDPLFPFRILKCAQHSICPPFNIKHVKNYQSSNDQLKYFNQKKTQYKEDEHIYVKNRYISQEATKGNVKWYKDTVEKDINNIENNKEISQSRIIRSPLQSLMHKFQKNELPYHYSENFSDDYRKLSKFGINDRQTAKGMENLIRFNNH